MALGDPQPGNRNDTIVYRTSGIDQKLAGRPVMADGAYRGNPDVITPYRKPADGSARKGEPAVQNIVGSVGGVRILVRYEPLAGKVLTVFPN